MHKEQNLTVWLLYFAQNKRDARISVRLYVSSENQSPKVSRR